MKLHGYLLIFFSGYSLASELHPTMTESYLKYVDFVLDGAVSEIEESPSGDFVYSGTNSDHPSTIDSITVYSKNPENGALTELHSYSHGLNGIDGILGITDIKVTSDNNCLFVSSNKQLFFPFDLQAHLTSFAINAETGELSLLEAIDRADPTNGNFSRPRTIILSDDNQFLYMTDHLNVLVFAVETADCQLNFLEKYAVSGGSWPGSGLEFDQSNDFLYVTVEATGKPNTGGLAVFQRDRTTGLLTQTNLYTSNGPDGILDLESPVDIEITADGGHLYALSFARDAVVMFEIDQQTGELTYGASYVNLTNGIEGLAQPRKLEISADQNFLVATGQWTRSLVVFRRNQDDGSLSYESTDYDNQNGFDFMDGIEDILLSKSGYLYTTSQDDRAIQIIQTNPVIIDAIFTDGFEH